MKPLILFLLLFLAGHALGQGLVNVNNRGLPTPQLVMISQSPWPWGGGVTPLVGTQWVAQIVYGPSNLPLGDPMPFRVPTTTSPGTWNPGAAGIRTLLGFAEGANVSMQVRVWDSSVFASWEAAAAALAAGGPPVGVNGTFAGASSPFTYTVGSPTNPASLIIQNFQGFTLTSISCLCPPPCYSDASAIHLIVPWNDGVTNLNLLSLLNEYLSANRPVSAPQWTANTPVERLFPNSPNVYSVSTYFEISGTLGSARLVGRPNVLGDFGFMLPPEIGYSANQQFGQVTCGLRAGWLWIRVYRPPRFVLLPPVGDLVRIRLEGMPGTRYSIFRSDRLGDFSPLTRITTGANGSYQGLAIKVGPSRRWNANRRHRQRSPDRLWPG